MAETWLSQDNESLCHIPNYKSHFLSRQNRHGGGIGILVNNIFNFKHGSDLDLLNDFIELTEVSRCYLQTPFVFSAD